MQTQMFLHETSRRQCHCKYNLTDCQRTYVSKGRKGAGPNKLNEVQTKADAMMHISLDLLCKRNRRNFFFCLQLQTF